MSLMDKFDPTVGELIELLSEYSVDQELYLCGDIYGGATLQVLHAGAWKDIWSVG